jgi:uroporphyrinogen decarboxylase
VTLQPLARFPLDAAILFSDILVIPHAMGLGLTVNEGVGPRFERPARTASDVHAIGVPDPETELRYVIDSVRLIRRELNGRVPLIGFAGSPWTMATYAVEGQGSKDFHVVKTMMYREPKILHELLDKLARAVVLYLNAQIAAGAQAVMVFDTWGGALSTPAYKEFSLRYMGQIVDGVRKDNEDRRVPCILFTKGGGQWLELIAETGCDAAGLDWTTDIGAARRRVGDRVALQGNMDPAVLLAAPERIRDEVASILSTYGPHPGHVFNLGHGITPDVDPANAGVFIDAVHSLSARK